MLEVCQRPLHAVGEKQLLAFGLQLSPFVGGKLEVGCQLLHDHLDVVRRSSRRKLRQRQHDRLIRRDRHSAHSTCVWSAMAVRLASGSVTPKSGGNLEAVAVRRMAVHDQTLRAGHVLPWQLEPVRRSGRFSSARRNGMTDTTKEQIGSTRLNSSHSQISYA